VVVVFLVCHSVKLIINGFEVYELVKSNVEESDTVKTQSHHANLNQSGQEHFIEEEENIETR
jgi:hypothetical protein